MKHSGLSEWSSSLNAELDILRENHLLRSLKFIPGIDFLSNDYLSLNKSGLILQIAENTIKNWKESFGSTGSRLLQGHSHHFEKAESDFASYTGYKSALLYQSGYSANLGTIPALINKNDIIISDRNCHASLIDGIRLSGAVNIRYRHNDLNHLREILTRKTGKKYKRIWIITETLFSMDGDSPDLKSLADLSEEFGALIYLDEAHAAGIYGPGGSGLISKHKLQKRIAVSVFPMGKAPGLSGAFVCGNSSLKEILVNKSRSFIFSTAQPPILASILTEIISFLQKKEAEILRNNLLKKSDLLLRILQEGGINTGRSNSQIIPVLCDDEKPALLLSEFLVKKGYAVRAIRPPSVPKGTSRLRLAVHADHTEDQIRNLGENIIKFFK